MKKCTAKKVKKDNKIKITTVELPLIKLKTLQDRFQAEIDYLRTDRPQTGSQAYLEGRILGIAWVCDYIQMLIDIQKESNI